MSVDFNRAAMLLHVCDKSKNWPSLRSLHDGAMGELMAMNDMAREGAEKAAKEKAAKAAEEQVKAAEAKAREEQIARVNAERPAERVVYPSARNEAPGVPPAIERRE